jgi:hypothetical protein
MDLGMLTQNGTSGALQIIPNPACETSCDEVIWNYWVVAVRPVLNEQYQWAVVSSPDQEMLFILARDPEVFRALYEATVLAGVAELGFTTPYNSPLETYQGEQCLYDEATYTTPTTLEAQMQSVNMKKLRSLLDELESER